MDGDGAIHGGHPDNDRFRAYAQGARVAVPVTGAATRGGTAVPGRSTPGGYLHAGPIIGRHRHLQRSAVGARFDFPVPAAPLEDNGNRPVHRDGIDVSAAATHAYRTIRRTGDDLPVDILDGNRPVGGASGELARHAADAIGPLVVSASTDPPSGTSTTS